MAFNPSAGTSYMGGISRANSQAEKQIASAVLKAQGYMAGAEDRAKLRMMGGSQQRQSSSSSPFGNDLIKAGSGLLQGLIGGGDSGMNFMDSVSMGENLGSFAGDYGAGAFDLNKSFF